MDTNWIFFFFFLEHKTFPLYFLHSVFNQVSILLSIYLHLSLMLEAFLTCLVEDHVCGVLRSSNWMMSWCFSWGSLNVKMGLSFPWAHGVFPEGKFHQSFAWGSNVQRPARHSPLEERKGDFWVQVPMCAQFCLISWCCVPHLTFPSLQVLGCPAVLRNKQDPVSSE